LVKNKELNSEILADIGRVCKGAKCSSYEIPRAIFLDHKLFSVDNEILTPTMKLKRNDAKKTYQAQLDELISRTASENPLKDSIA